MAMIYFFIALIIVILIFFYFFFFKGKNKINYIKMYFNLNF